MMQISLASKAYMKHLNISKREKRISPLWEDIRFLLSSEPLRIISAIFYVTNTNFGITAI